MKYTVFLFSVLTVIWIKYVRALQEDSMDTYKTTISLNEPSWGSSSSGILKSHFGTAYRSNYNKTLTVYAPSGYSILASIRLIDLRPNNQDSLKLFAVYDPVTPVTYTNSKMYKSRRFYPREELTFYAPSGKLGITFTTGPSYSTSGFDGFELIYTVQAYWINCNSRDFHCDNGRCIATILSCDGHNHCGDESSEKKCSNFTPSSGRTIGIAFGVVFLLIALACGVFVIIRRARRSDTDTTTIVTSHPPPTTNLPSYPPAYPQSGNYYPPPPPPYSQGVTNPTYH